jgi:hypothetical protein
MHINLRERKREREIGWGDSKDVQFNALHCSEYHDDETPDERCSTTPRVKIHHHNDTTQYLTSSEGPESNHQVTIETCLFYLYLFIKK